MTKTETNANFERSKVAGTLVLNKVFELLSLLILCYVLTWFINLPAVWVVPVRFLVFFIIAFLLLFAFNVVNLKKIAIPKNRFLKVAYNFLMSLKLIEDKLLLLKTLMLSFFIWGIELSMINILFTAFNLSFPFWVSIFVLISINLAMLIPATNASFGPYEYAIVIVLTMYGVSKEIALSFAVALHFLEIIFVLLLGLMFYLKMRRKESCLVQ